MRELKAHLVRGADDRVRSGRDGKHFFFCECSFVGFKSEDFLSAFCVLHASVGAFDLRWMITYI